MNVITDLHLSLSTDDILRGQGLNSELIHVRKPALLAAAKRAYSRGLSLLHPKALTREIAVLARRHDRILLKDGLSLSSPVVMRHLGGALRVVAAICTIGQELEESVTNLLESDPQLALALDGLGNAAVEMLAQQVCADIGKKLQDRGLKVSTPLSPGSLEWPVEIGQPQIFSLLEPARVGIKLTTGGMMIPKKSISFVLGIGYEMAQSDMCEICSLKETCRYRYA